MKEIDHEYTYDIVCPYCGHVNRDSWELSADDGEAECGECEKEFSYTRHITIEYSTKKAAPVQQPTSARIPSTEATAVIKCPRCGRRHDPFFSCEPK